ncbi:MAG: hypothetical protein U5L96_11340 [Owenweeksia sp.]|nr:hypothetical protein [Owenweeksia sp.]
METMMDPNADPYAVPPKGEEAAPDPLWCKGRARPQLGAADERLLPARSAAAVRPSALQILPVKS